MPCRGPDDGRPVAIKDPEYGYLQQKVVAKAISEARAIEEVDYDEAQRHADMFITNPFFAGTRSWRDDVVHKWSTDHIQHAVTSALCLKHVGWMSCKICIKSQGWFAIDHIGKVRALVLIMPFHGCCMFKSGDVIATCCYQCASWGIATW
jgi:hypothetical protein